MSLLILFSHILPRKEEGHDPAKHSTKAPTLKKQEILKNQFSETVFISCYFRKRNESCQVPPRFELGSLDSESRVLTITPWDPLHLMLLYLIRK